MRPGPSDANAQNSARYRRHPVLLHPGRFPRPGMEHCLQQAKDGLTTSDRR